MSVAIITITLNQQQYIKDFLEELSTLSYRDFTLYIIDNGSREDQQVDDLIRAYSWVKLIKTGRNLGYAGGNNVGIRRAIEDGHDLIWLVNNDVTFDPDCLTRLVDYLNTHPAAGAVGPKMYYHTDPDRIWFAGGTINWSRPFPYTVCTHRGEGVMDQGQFEQVQPVDFITGAGILVRSELLGDLGGFDERYFAYFEDADLCLRIHRSGREVVYVPTAKMLHMVGVLSGVT